MQCKSNQYNTIIHPHHNYKSVSLYGMPLLLIAIHNATNVVVVRIELSPIETGIFVAQIRKPNSRHHFLVEKVLVLL